MQVPMNVLMLGQDYQYTFAPLGDTLSLNATPDTGFDPSAVKEGYHLKLDAAGKPALDAAGRYQIEADLPAAQKSALLSNITTFLKDSGLGTAAKDTILGAIAAKYGPAAAGQYNKSAGFDVGANMPWIILGGAALIGLLFVMGTRKK